MLVIVEIPATFTPACLRAIASGTVDMPTASAPATPMAPRFGTPQTYTPKHLAEKILTSKSALEGERKQVTVLFADVKGSMDLAEQLDAPLGARVLDLGGGVRRAGDGAAP
mgnify:CR=1 FL=1